jgi:hypothetical protein
MPPLTHTRDRPEGEVALSSGSSPTTTRSFSQPLPLPPTQPTNPPTILLLPAHALLWDPLGMRVYHLVWLLRQLPQGSRAPVLDEGFVGTTTTTSPPHNHPLSRPIVHFPVRLGSPMLREASLETLRHLMYR